MASLAATLAKKRNSSGQLVEDEPTPLPQLAGQAGIGAPISAVGAGMIGATPDQQKMAGTPQQKQGALAQAAGGAAPQTLQDAMRSKGPAQATAGEQGKLQQASQLGQLSTLSDRVQSLVGGYFNKLAAPAAQQLTAAENIQDLTGLPPAQVAQVKGLLEQFTADPTNMNLLDQATKAAGFTNPITPDKVPNYLADAASVVAKEGAAAVKDENTVNVGALIDSGGIGFTEDQLAGLLKVQPAAVRNMTIPDLRNSIAQIEQQEFQDVNKLQKMLSDPGISTAERTAARDQLRSLGETGLRTADAQFADLQRAVKDADVVQFGGDTYTVANLLKDSNVNRIIANYLHAPPEDTARQKLVATEPEFTKWIDSNANAFQEAVKKVQGGFQQYSDIQTYNRGLRNINGADPGDLAWSKILPGYDPNQPLSASKTDAESRAKPIYQSLKGPGGAMVANLLRDVGKSAANDATQGPMWSGILDELVELSPDEISKLGIDKDPHAPKWVAYKNWMQAKDRISKLNPQTDPAGVIEAYFGQRKNPIELQQSLDLENTYKALGLNNSADAIAKVLDVNGDGHPDSPAEIKQTLMNRLGTISLKDMTSDRGADIPGTMKIPGFSGDQKNQQVYQMLAPFAADGKITTDEANQADISHFMDDIELPPEFVKANPDVAKIIEDRAGSARVQKYLRFIPGLENVTQMPEVQKNLDDMQSTITTDYPTQQERKDAVEKFKKFGLQLDDQIVGASRDNKHELAADLREARGYLNKYQIALDTASQVGDIQAIEPTVTATANPPVEEKKTPPGDGRTPDPGTLPPQDKNPGVWDNWVPKVIQNPQDLLHPERWPKDIADDTIRTITLSMKPIQKAIDALSKGLVKVLDIPADAYHRLAAALGVEVPNLKASILEGLDGLRKKGLIPSGVDLAQAIGGDIKKVGDAVKKVNLPSWANNLDEVGKIDPSLLGRVIKAGDIDTLKNALPINSLKTILNKANFQDASIKSKLSDFIQDAPLPDWAKGDPTMRNFSSAFEDGKLTTGEINEMFKPGGIRPDQAFKLLDSLPSSMINNIANTGYAGGKLKDMNLAAALTKAKIPGIDTIDKLNKLYKLVGVQAPVAPTNPAEVASFFKDLASKTIKQIEVHPSAVLNSGLLSKINMENIIGKDALNQLTASNAKKAASSAAASVKSGVGTLTSSAKDTVAATKNKVKDAMDDFAAGRLDQAFSKATQAGPAGEALQGMFNTVMGRTQKRGPDLAGAVSGAAGAVSNASQAVKMGILTAELDKIYAIDGSYRKIYASYDPRNSAYGQTTPTAPGSEWK